MTDTPLSVTSVTPTLTVDDLAESVRWYTEVVGFRLSRLFEDSDGRPIAAAVRAGAVGFYLRQDDWARGRNRDKGTGLRHYLEVDGDLDALARAIQDRGGTLDHEPTDREWGTRDFTVTDPSGYVLSFSTPFADQLSE